MENRTDVITEDQLQDALRGPVTGLAFLGVIIAVVIILSAVAIYFLYRKLRQHEEAIQDLEDPERGLRSGDEVLAKDKDNNLKNSHGDSAIEMGSVGRSSETGSGDVGESWSRHHSNSGSHMSVVIRKERTNMYGCTPRTSQVIMVAQAYYKTAHNTSDEVAPESIKMSNKHTNPYRASNVFTEDWREGRTTSMLLDSLGTLTESNLTNNKAMFVHKTIDISGGILEISGVSLNIPKGALDSSELISLGIIWEENYYPDLTKKKTLLSPVILCQPCGLTFKVPVTLNFPHCADNVSEDWDITVMTRSGDLSEQTAWTEAGFGDYSDRDIEPNTISLKLNHFTLYTCVGESRDGKMAAKAVHLVAFVSPLSPGGLFKPRIYCLNNYREELKDAEYLTCKMVPGARVAETSDLIVHDNDQDLVVKLDKISEKWKLKGDNQEILSFEQVWHAMTPHVTFLLKPQDSVVSEVYCDFTCYQKQRENAKARLKIAEEKAKGTSPLTACTEYPEQELINEIIIHLDPEKVGDAGDWRDLAEKLGCDLARIGWLGTQSSPTRLLIDMWLDEGHDLSELSQTMEDINRPDVAAEINKRWPGLKT